MWLFLPSFLLSLWLCVCNVFDKLLGDICKEAFTVIHDVLPLLYRLKNFEKRLSFIGNEFREHIFLGTIWIRFCLIKTSVGMSPPPQAQKEPLVATLEHWILLGKMFFVYGEKECHSLCRSCRKITWYSKFVSSQMEIYQHLLYFTIFSLFFESYTYLIYKQSCIK